jgi:hypothetical protein
MHMLRDEDNAGYRKVIRDTLEFDPGVLGRFVNFMTNPDERPAAEQFGTGDKAFAVATLLATLPGLPMLGHGQVEGLHERYGMEFRTARLDEAVDEGHVEHFRRVIVPLLRRRADFAGTEHFQLYDAVSPDGGVLQDVFAYSNGIAGRRTLVVVHNRFGEADIRIERSVPVASRDGAGRRRLTATRLDRALDLPEDPAVVARFRDARSGRELRATSGALREGGLELHAGPYEAMVFDIDVVSSEPQPAPGDTAELGAPEPTRPKRPGPTPARVRRRASAPAPARPAPRPNPPRPSGAGRRRGRGASGSSRSP